MSILQLFLILFGLFMMYIVRVHYKKNQLGRFELLLWLVVWAMFIVVNIIPESLIVLVESFQVARLFDLLVIVALMIVTFVSLTSRFQIKVLERKLERLVRERAIAQKKAIKRK